MSFTPVTKTVADIAATVKRQFGDESGAQVTNEDIIRWVDEAQRAICNKNKILKARATADLIEGQHTYALPEANIAQIESIRTENGFLRSMEFPTAENTVLQADPRQNASGTPTHWYEWAGQITLWPTPSATVEDGISLYYTKNPSPVSALSDPLSLPDKYYERIIELVLAKAYELDENFEAAAFKKGEAAAGLDEMNNEERASSHMTYQTITFYED